MKIFFIDSNLSYLADAESKMLHAVRTEILKFDSVTEVTSPDQADVLLIEEVTSYKDFRYIDELLKDPLVSRYTHKVFTINRDDCATGLLRGLYTSIPRSRFNARMHVSVPYMDYPNELVLSHKHQQQRPLYLASWRGNTKSNRFRLKMMDSLQTAPGFLLEKTNSWLNHQPEEKENYVALLLNAKFSLCPAGWAPVSFRIYESMALGRCPVILADEFVPPAGPNWREIALFFPQKQVADLPSFLLQHEQQYEQIGAKALAAWKKFFCPEVIAKYYAQSLYSLVVAAPASSKEEEIKRWKSLSFYWSNNWTLPQRLINKARKLSRAL